MAAGSISKRVRPNGAVRYRAIVDLGPDLVTGKRRQRYKDCITRRAAQIALAALKREVDQGTAVDRSPQTVTDVLAYWLESYAQFKAPRTYEGYRYTIRTYVESAEWTLPAGCGSGSRIALGRKKWHAKACCRAWAVAHTERTTKPWTRSLLFL